MNLGLRQRLVLHVDEQGPRERRVAAVAGGIHARGDAAFAAVDLEGLERVLVLLVVREAEVPHPARIPGDGLHDDVVVLARRVVGPACAFLAVDLVGEVVERARVRAGARERERLVGEARVDLVPVRDLALGRRLPDLLELVDRQAGGPVVRGVDDDRERVDADLELGVLDAGLFADRDLFLVVDRARGVRDVGLAGAEALEAAACSGRADFDVDAGLLLAEGGGSSSRQGAYRARAVDDDVSGKLFGGRLAGRLLDGRRVGVVLRILATAPDRAERQGRERQQKEDKPRDRTNFHRSPFASCHRGECRPAPSAGGLKGCERVVKRW